MKIRTLVITLALVIGSFTPALAQSGEKVTLSASEVPPATTEYKIGYFAIDVRNTRVIIELDSNTGAMKQIVYTDNTAFTCPTNGVVVPAAADKATKMISGLNSKADMRAESLEKRIYKQLQADGCLVGAITGTPRGPEMEALHFVFAGTR